MGRAEDLFQKIMSEKETAIDQFINERKSEELFLDFKRSSDNGNGSRLSQIDRDHFAKAISGFGNSEGGILIWGVDCRPDIDCADIAKNKVFITNPKRFASWLNSTISGCTIPPHQTVKNEPINVDDNKGFVVSLIPKSNNTPHQMIVKKQYYIRAGSDFIPTPHDVLAGMFGRRPQPHIIHQFLVSPINVNMNHISIEIGFLLKNIGPGIASDVYLNCSILSGIGSNCKLEFERNDPNNWYGQFSLGMHLSLISKSDLRLPPDAFWMPTTLHLDIIPPINKPLKMNAIVGCSSGRSYSFSFINSPEKIGELYKECLLKHASGELDGQEYDFVNKIINSDYQKLDE